MYFHTDKIGLETVDWGRKWGTAKQSFENKSGLLCNIYIYLTDNIIGPGYLGLCDLVHT